MSKIDNLLNRVVEAKMTKYRRMIFAKRHESHLMYLVRLYLHNWKDYFFGVLAGCFIAWFLVYSIDARADTGYENAVACVALNIYHEAQFEPYDGRKAVAFVTLERMKQSGKEVCEVVFAKRQFSWTHRAMNGAKLHSDYVPKNTIRWRKAQYVARMSMSGYLRNPVPEATHYHASYVRPKWADNMRYLGKIGSHLFYSER